MIEETLAQINLKKMIKEHGGYFPSPDRWEDNVLYFLMLDRFSDGNENDYKDNNGKPVFNGGTPLFTAADNGNAVFDETAAKLWREQGGKWCGGKLKGLTSKIGYLKRLGVTAIWVSPVFKQIKFQDTYHGYGIQNFIDIDPHFGPSREELREMVKIAHQHGLYVILDIILNHAGHVFSYVDGGNWNGSEYRVNGYNDAEGNPVIPYGQPVTDAYWPDGAVWPREFQAYNTFSRKGRIQNWDYDPEYREGDFYDLKDIRLGSGNVYNYNYSPALRALVKAYQFWIAYADIDGFRIDTVKHMDDGATRFFASAIHEFAQLIGKENFYLIGEITGGRDNAFIRLENTGLDAALGLDELQGKLEWVAKGYCEPKEYFDLFRHSLALGKDSHAWFRDKIVTMFDDHDQVRKGENKARFCAGNDSDKLVMSALALNLFSEGIPCIYYGSEQGFDGAGGNDRYIRETMFGGSFGAFRSKDRHFFDEENPVYRQLAAMIQIRKKRIEIRRGRQYLRPISGDGVNFGYPVKMGERLLSVVAWSRIFYENEILIAINTDPDNERSAWVTIDDPLHETGDYLSFLAGSNDLVSAGKLLIEAINGKSVYLTVPPGGYVMFE